jgi:histidyl-tRNA synthetase
VVRALGLGPDDVRVRLSDRRVLSAILSARGVPASGMTRAFEFIDKAERLRPEDIQQWSSTPQAFAPATIDDLLEVSKIRGWDELDAELGRSPELTKAAEPLRETCRALAAMGQRSFLEVDLTIVRGLAYYTGVVFELFDTGRTLRAICGGGRYDNLLRDLGGVDLPALGFGMGDVVLGELLKEKRLVPSEASSIDVFLAFITKDDVTHLLGLAHQLRDDGLRVEYALGPQALGKQLKLADARHARLAVVLGPDERARGEVILRDLRSGTQEAVPHASAAHIIKARLHG